MIFGTMILRRVLATVGLMSALALSACGDSDKAADGKPTINFSILSAENQQSMEPLWQPLLTDIEKQTGVHVKAYFAANYAALVTAMQFNQTQVGWFSASPALEAVNRADAEVLARVVDPGGDATYTSVLIVKKGSGITLDKVMACGKRYSLGMGDPQSTSGTLAPMYYLFTPKGVDLDHCFSNVKSASHQANFGAVANGILDVATNNSVGLLFARRETPAMAQRVETIWTSPPLPESAIVARKDLDPAIREKLRSFFLTYGTASGAEGDRQRAVLKGLAYGGFRPADDTYLDPIRLMVANGDLVQARKSGDPAKLAVAKKAFDAITAKVAATAAAKS
jgi:phosphonate transport system substrate-binding protein